MSKIRWSVAVLTAVSAFGSASASSPTWHLPWVKRPLPAREDRLNELKALLVSARADPAAACDTTLPDAEKSGRFENGSSFLRGDPYQEADLLKLIKDEACRCKERMAAPEEEGAGRGRKSGARRVPPGAAPGVFTVADVATADAAILAFVADSFMHPTATSQAAVQRLPEAIKAATREVLAMLYVDGDRAVMSVKPHPAKLVGNMWVRCLGETRFTPFSDNDGRGLGLGKLIEARREEVAGVERQRASSQEEADRQRKAADDLAAQRQTPEYWAEQLDVKLTTMVTLTNHANGLMAKGYGRLAKDEAWPAAQAAERDLCAVVSDMRSTAPRVAPRAREVLLKSIAYNQGDRSAQSAGALLDRYLKGQCNLLGR